MATSTNSQFMVASLTEFISVWAVGGEASLSLTTSRGSATVAFNCTLGPPGAPHTLPPPSAPSPLSPPRRSRHRGPGEKEKNRQRAARHQEDLARRAAPVTSAAPAGSASQATEAQVTTAPVETSTPVISPPVMMSPPVTTDSVESPMFYCDICEFSTTTNRGVKTHKGHKHREELRDEVVNNSLNISEVDYMREEGKAPPLANSTLQSEVDIDDDETVLITDKDTSPDGETLNEGIFMLKPELEYWTWPRNKSPPPKVHHPQDGLGISPNLYTDALGFDQISYRFKTGVCDVFEIT